MKKADEKAKLERLTAYWYARLKSVGFRDVESRVAYSGWTFEQQLPTSEHTHRGSHVSTEECGSLDNASSLADSADATFWRMAEHAAQRLPDDFPNREYLVAVSISGYIKTEGPPRGIKQDKAARIWAAFVKNHVMVTL